MPENEDQTPDTIDHDDEARKNEDYLDTARGVWGPTITN
jgi:hypothetical protein